MDIDEIIENFEILDDCDDRYKYLIELGTMLDELPEAERTRENKVQGCVSQVWVTSAKSDGPEPVLTFTGASDAHIVSGLIAITFAVFSGRKAKEILELDEKQVFGRINLSEHITPQRSNGLRALVERIKSDAAAAIAGAAAGV